MSEVKRYNTELEKDIGLGLPCLSMKVNPFGEWVHYKDYTALQQKLDAANAELARYSMCAGQADQFAAEAKAVRKALGFTEDSDDVSPVDLLEKISGLKESLSTAEAKLTELENFALYMADESVKAGNYPDGWQCKASNAAQEYAEACRATILRNIEGKKA